MLYSKGASGTASGTGGGRPATSEVDPEDWIVSRLKRAEDTGMFAEVETLTPAIAAALLRLNTRNRKESKRGVEDFSAALREGRFRTLARGIAIASDAAINDGQHKLLAIVATGITARVMVGWGESPSDYNVHDQGGAGSRTASQLLRTLRVEDPVACAAAARLLVGWKQRYTSRISNDVIEAYMADNPKLPDSVKEGKRLYAAIKGRTAPTPLIVTHYLISTRSFQNGHKLAYFWDSLVSNAQLPDGALLDLANDLRLGSVGNKKLRLGERNVSIVEHMALSWKKFALNRKTRVVLDYSSDNMPFIQ